MITSNILIFIMGGMTFLFAFSYFKDAAIEVFKKEPLQFATDAFKADKEVVMAAVNNYGEALQFATDEMRTLLSK